MTEPVDERSYISNATLFNTLLDIRGKMGNLEAGHANIQSAILSVGASHAALGTRVTSLEMARARQTGALAAVGALGGVLGSVGTFLGHMFFKGSG